MKEPGTLSFSDDKPTTQPPVAPSSQPGVVSFDNVQLPTKIVEPPAPTNIGALNMPAQSTIKQKPKPPVALFNAGPCATEKAAADHAKDRFVGLSQSQIERVQRQIQQLIPVNVNLVSTWGDKALNFQAEHTVLCAKYTREFAQLNGAELIDRVIKATQPQTSIVGKFLSRNESALQYKPALLTLQNSLQMLLTCCDDLKISAARTQERIMLNMIALSAVCDTVGQSANVIVDDAIKERTMLLHQATNQITLTCAHLDQLRQQIQDVQSRITQLLFVTIPALELAATQK